MRIAKIWHQKWQAFSLYRGRKSLARALLRWVAWAVRCVLKWPAVVGIPRYDMRLFLLPRWRGCWKPLFVFRERFFEVSEGPELDFAQRILKPGDTFVDVGAFHGWYSLVASRAVGRRGRVLAFEPNPETYATLLTNLALNNSTNVLTFNEALSDVDSTAWLYQGEADGSYSALAPVEGTGGRVQVATRRLDAVVREVMVQHVSMMKVDVEGAEVLVFRGAADLLTTSRPVVVFEVNASTVRMGGSPEAAWNFLSALNYKFFLLSGGAPVPLLKFPTLQQNTVLNIVAVPEEQYISGMSDDRPRQSAGSRI
jgi:FkbM family methyltransferase